MSYQNEIVTERIRQLERERDAALAANAAMRVELSFLLSELDEATGQDWETRLRYVDELIRRLPGFSSLSTNSGRELLERLHNAEAELASRPVQAALMAAAANSDRADEAEEALREICIACEGGDPADGEGTTPQEIKRLVDRRIAALRATIEYMKQCHQQSADGHDACKRTCDSLRETCSELRSENVVLRENAAVTPNAKLPPL